MRKLNLRWLVGLVLGIIILSGCSYFLHGFQMRRNASVFLREARRAQDEGRTMDALGHFRRYAVLAPDDMEGMISLGFQLSDVGRIQPAYLTLEKALRQMPERDDVRRRLVKLAMAMGEYSDAMDHLQNHLLKGDSCDGELLEQMGICQAAKSDYSEAAESFTEAIQCSPDRLDVYLKLISLLQKRLNRSADAHAVMAQMVSQNPQNHRARLVHAQWLIQPLLSRDGKLSSAIDQDVQKQIDEDLSVALSLSPEDADTLLLSAQFLRMKGQTDEARRHLQQGMESHSNDHRFPMALSLLESEFRDKAAARKVLETGVQNIPTNCDLRWELANLLIDLGDYEQAETQLQSLKSFRFTEDLVNYLDGFMRFRKKEWREAISVLEGIRPGLRDKPNFLRQVHLWLAVAYGEMNSPEQQLSSLRRAAALDTDPILTRLAIAESLVETNQLTEAASEFRQIINSKAEAPAAAALGLAKTLIRINLRTSPEQQSWEEFDSILRRVEKPGIEPVSVALLRMEEQLTKGNHDAAVKVITEALLKDPSRIELWTAQISLAQVVNQGDKVEALIGEATKQLGDVPSLRIVRARYLIERQAAESNPDLTAELVKLAEPNPEWSEVERIQQAYGFAALLVTVKAFEEAMRIASFLTEVAPNSLRAWLIQLDIAMRAGNSDQISKVLDSVERLTDKSPTWHYGKAAELTLLGEATNNPEYFSNALTHLKDAKVSRPNWELIPFLQAEILEKRGETSAAIDQYLEAIRLGERRPDVCSHALGLLFEAKRFEDADKLIRRLRESAIPLSDDLVKAEVDLSMRFGRTDQAIKLTEKIVATSTRSQDRVWLGNAYTSLGQYLKEDEQSRLYTAAQDQFRQAIQNDPEDATAWVGLVKVYALSKQEEKALEAVDRVQTLIPAEKSLVIAGQCYELLGKLDSAQASYRKAVEQAPNDRDLAQVWIEFLLKTRSLDEAENAIRRLLSTTKDSDAAESRYRQWAHRKLAITLATKGGRENSQQALKEIENNQQNASPEDLRVKAAILASGFSSEDRSKAISILEPLVAQDPNAPAMIEDRFLLARLYLATGNRTKGRSELRKLIAARKDDPRFLVSFIQLCLDSKEPAEADVYMNLLENVAANQLPTLEIKSRILFAKGRYEDTFDFLKSIGQRISGVADSDEGRFVKQYWLAKRFEEFATLLKQVKKDARWKNFATEAETLYQPLMKDHPEEILSFADFLIKMDQIDKGLDLLEAQEPGAKPDRVAMVATSVILSPLATNEQQSRLNSILKANLEKQRHSISLLNAMADLNCWRGEVALANDLYREVLKLDSKNIAALNNLAFLISLTAGGNQEEALDLIKRAVASGGPVDSLEDTRGLIHLAAGHPEVAVIHFEYALGIRESAERHFHAAVAYARQNNKASQARKSLDRADELGLNERELHPLERSMLSGLRLQLKEARQAG